MTNFDWENLIAWIVLFPAIALLVAFSLFLIGYDGLSSSWETFLNNVGNALLVMVLLGAVGWAFMTVAS